MRQFRKVNRWYDFNYSSNATYFITICTKDRIAQFGKVSSNEMHYSNIGKIAVKHLAKLNELFEDGELHISQVMPNHIHLLYTLNNEEKDKFYLKQIKITEQRFKMIIPQRIKSFKTSVLKEIRNEGYESFNWQRSFHDHVVRDEESFKKIYWYIKNNPKNWAEDLYNPKNS